MSALAKLLVPASAAALLACAACSGGVDAGGLDPQAGVVATQVTGQGDPLTTQQLLARIESSITEIAFHGERRVRMDYRVLGGERELEYVERVVSDGEGGFGMVVGEILSPAMTPDEEEFFRILQESRQGFFYRYRDFRIRDLALFQQGYTLRQTGLATICERPCVVLEVRHRERRGRWYRVAVDPRTGVVMRAEEHAGAANRIVASVEFEAFEEGSPAEEIALYQTRIERDRVDLTIDTVDQVGFQVLRPTLLPEGYRFEGADSMQDPDGRTWVRQVFADGVEHLFFLQSPVVDGFRPLERGAALEGFGTSAAPGRTTGQTGPNGELGTAEDLKDDRVTVAAVGPWTVVEGTVRGRSVVAIGKVVESELLQLVQSALETRR